MLNHPLHIKHVLFSVINFQFLFSHLSSPIFTSSLDLCFYARFRGNRRRSVILFLLCAHVHDVILVASAAHIFMQITLALFDVDGLLRLMAKRETTHSANVLISFADNLRAVKLTVSVGDCVRITLLLVVCVCVCVNCQARMRSILCFAK